MRIILKSIRILIFVFVFSDSSLAQVRMYSDFVKDTFSIFINLPKDYSKNPDKKYPVVYLLDANYYFHRVSIKLNKNDSESILVGIGYKNFEEMDSLRNRDYTFPKALAEDSFSISGGAKTFLSYIEKELIPYMDQHYRTDSCKRTIMGHSLGGYFVLFALGDELKKQTTHFNYFVAASPSLHYCNHYLLKLFQDITDTDTNSRGLFLTIGALEDKEEGDTSSINMDNFNALKAELCSTKFKNLKIRSQVYHKFEHMQTAMPSFVESLKKNDIFGKRQH